MKIKDLITLKKIDKLSSWANETEKKYFKKNGYFWEIPSHSSHEGVLLNNYEKDCVVAYIKNKYFITFLIKMNSNKYRGFCYLKDFLRSVAGSYTYTINNIYDNKGMMDLFDGDRENLIIVEEKEYGRFNKLLILEAMKI